MKRLFITIFLLLLESGIPLRAQPDELIEIHQNQIESLITAVKYYNKIFPNHKTFSMEIRIDSKYENPDIIRYTFQEYSKTPLRHFGGNGKYFAISVSTKTNEIVNTRWIRDK